MLVKVNYFNGEETFVKFEEWIDDETFCSFAEAVRKSNSDICSGKLNWYILDENNVACEIGDSVTCEAFKSLLPSKPIELYLTPSIFGSSFICSMCNQKIYGCGFKNIENQCFFCKLCASEKSSQSLMYIPHNIIPKKELMKTNDDQKRDKSSLESIEEAAKNVEPTIINALSALTTTTESLIETIQKSVEILSTTVGNPITQKNLSDEVTNNVVNSEKKMQSTLDAATKVDERATTAVQTSKNFTKRVEHLIEKIVELFQNSTEEVAETSSKNSIRIVDLVERIELIASSVSQISDSLANKSQETIKSKDHGNKINETKLQSSIAQTIRSDDCNSNASFDIIHCDQESDSSDGDNPK